MSLKEGGCYYYRFFIFIDFMPESFNKVGIYEVKTLKLKVMKAVLKIVVICFLSVSIFSCQKELSIDTSLPGGNNNGGTDAAALIGDWKFVSNMVNVESSTTYSQGGIPFKAIASYKDTTEDNTGTLTVTSSSFNIKNLGYTISTNVEIVIPLSPDDNQSLPFEYTVPALNSTTSYQLIGSDSLYFPSGTIFQTPDPTGTLPSSSPPSGAKFKITGSNLAIMASSSQKSTQTQSGITVDVTTKASIIANFQK